MKKNPLITIFTATFNREQLIVRLFNSLDKQSNKNFEWLIVDDGSDDNTEKTIKSLAEETTYFKISYFKQPNQGKHIAINKGLEKAKGRYFFIVDSDDRLPENAIDIISKKIKKIDDNSKVAGVVGKAHYFDGSPLGASNIRKDVVCSIFDYRYKYNQVGDYENVIKTKIFRKFPFPQYMDEKFVAESIVWNRIGQQYNWYFFKENVYECEYQEDGLSSKTIQLRRKYPIGALNLYAEQAEINKISIKYKIRAYINYWRFYFSKKFNFYERKMIRGVAWYAYFLLPLGLLISIKDSLNK